MTGEKYKMGTLVTREEFDEMKDWWFLNKKNITEKQVSDLGDESFWKTVEFRLKIYFDGLPDEND